MTEIRTFSTGSTRDTDEGKLNYLKALSPLVLQRYVEYLSKHRRQSDGTLRDFDNWKQGIPEQTYKESLLRHVIALWLLHEGYSAKDNHGLVDIEDTLMAIIFNAMGCAYEILRDKDENKNRI
jgi:hypothetical protein